MPCPLQLLGSQLDPFAARSEHLYSVDLVVQNLDIASISIDQDSCGLLPGKSSNIVSNLKALDDYVTLIHDVKKSAPGIGWGVWGWPVGSASLRLRTLAIYVASGLRGGL